MSEVIPGVISLILTTIHCSSLAAPQICYFLGPNTIHSPTVTTLSHLITGDCLDVSRPTWLLAVTSYEYSFGRSWFSMLCLPLAGNSRSLDWEGSTCGGAYLSDADVGVQQRRL